SLYFNIHPSIYFQIRGIWHPYFTLAAKLNFNHFLLIPFLSKIRNFYAPIEEYMVANRCPRTTNLGLSAAFNGYPPLTLGLCCHHIAVMAPHSHAGTSFDNN